MREVDKKIKVMELVEVEKRIITETVDSRYERRQDQQIIVSLGQRGTDGKVVRTLDYSITGEMYDLLMSQDERFREDKPLNDFNDDDVLIVLDVIEASQNQPKDM